MNLLKIDDTTANKISYYHIALLMASLPFDMFYSHLITVSFGLHTLIHLSKKNIQPIFTWRMLALLSVFFVSLLSALYTANAKGAGDEIGRRATVVIFPLLLCLNPIDLNEYRERLFLWFALVCTMVIVYLYADAVITIRHFHLPLRMMFSGAFANHNFSEPINMHATFFSMQVALALIFLLSKLVKESARNKQIIYLIGVLILTGGLIQLSSKSVFIALFVIINIALPYFLLKGIGRKRYILVTASLSVLLIAGILWSDTFRERYVTELTADLSPAKSGEVVDSRLARWSVIIDLIGKKPVTGYGAGTEIGLLHNSFFEHKLYNSFLHDLNSHNEYLSFMLKSGIVGLLVYIATLAFGLTISVQQKDPLFFAFMLMVVTVSFSENLLDVDKGIIYYVFFFSFFMLSRSRNGEDNVTLKLP